MPDILTLPLSRIADANGNPYPGALLDVFLTGSTTPATVYQDAALTVAHANPIVADAGGLLPVIFLDPTVIYRFRARTSAGAVISGYDFDPVSTATLRDFVSPQDFDAVGDGVTNDITAITTAAETYPGRLWAGGGLTYKITANLPAGWRMIDGTILDSRMVTADDEYAVLALGEHAGESITYIPEQHAASGGRFFASGNHIVYLGWGAGRYNSIGRRNTLIGSRVGAAGSALSPTTFNYTTGVGSQAFESLTSGVENCAFGTQAMQTTTTGYGNACFGVGAGLRLTVGFYNSYFGYGSGPSNTVANNANGGSYNVGIGYRAHYVNENGTNNIAIGADSMVSATSADDCIGIGRNALLNVVNDIAIIGIGTDALRNTVGATESMGIGQEALKAQTTGSKNTALGWQAGLVITTNGECLFLGYRAGFTVTGPQNVLVGPSTGATLTTGDHNTLIGYGADTIAAASNSTAIGNGASATKSNQVVLGNANVTETLLRGYTKHTIYTSGSLPAAATAGAGARAFVSDSSTTTFAASYTAGGANTVPVYSDGSDWRIG